MGSKAFTRVVNDCEGLKYQAFTPEKRLEIKRKAAFMPLLL